MRSRAKRLLLPASCAALLALAFAFGVAVGKYQIFPYAQVRDLRDSLVRFAEAFGPRDGASEDADVPDGNYIAGDTAERLAALGYLGGYELAEKVGGTTRLDAASVHPGLTLFCTGHAPVASLISLAGEVVHRWEIAFEELWPPDLPFTTSDSHRKFLRRAHVFPNGDLLAVFEYIGICKLDKDSKVLWKNLNQSHHDFAVAADGSIVTLVRTPRSSEKLASEYPGTRFPLGEIFDDEVVFLDSSGVEQRRVSILDALHRSDYALALNPRAEFGDLFHANSVDLIEDDQRQSVIATGEVLISLRRLNAILSLDVEEGRVSWMLSGQWKGQHQAQLLENGNVLLLDNLGGNGQAPLEQDQSEVLEVNPLTQEIVWRYRGSEESPFFTKWLGYVQRLPNGNTLVTETKKGRIFEVTTEGRIVWEYRNPHRAGDEGELIATVMGAKRIRREDLTFLDR